MLFLSIHEPCFEILRAKITGVATQGHLANDVVLVVFLVQGQNGRDELGDVFLQFIASHQMAH